MQGKDMSEPDATTPVYAGVDVCKDWLDVHLHPSGARLRMANDRFGLRRLKRLLAPRGPTNRRDGWLALKSLRTR